jgi:hypothetical protein
MASFGVRAGQDTAEPGEHVEQADVEAVEDIVWRVGEQLARADVGTVVCSTS